MTDLLLAIVVVAAIVAFGRKINVMDYQLHPTPIPTIAFHDTELDRTVLCTFELPQTLLPMLKKKGSSPRSELRVNPVFRISKKTPAIELSMLNAGSIFDIELPTAWNTLTGQMTESDTLWIYILNV